MLIRFSIENHLSIREEQEFSFVASSIKDPIGAIFEVPNSGFKLLPASLFYGANASGKSNIVAGLQFISSAIKLSHERGNPEGGVPRLPFMLEKKWTKKPTRCNVEFILNGIRYEYGFSCDDKIFLEEWLYTFPKGKRQTLYVRHPDRKSISFGKNFRGSAKTIESLMRKNSLFLSVAAQNASNQLTPIFSYLTGFTFKFGVESNAMQAQSEFSDGKFDARIIRMLKRADTGISSFKFEDLNINKASPFVKEFSALLKKHLNSPELDLDDLKGKKISFGHDTADGEAQYLNLSSESSGTLRLLVLFKEVFAALDRGTLLVIDELDASLHTYLVEDIVALFNSETANTKGAQLLATTHDTNLLCGKLLRRDQIWFVEKDKAGASVIYPLTDIQTRNSDNIEDGYLEGRFGAVPFRGRLDTLIGEEA